LVSEKALFVAILHFILVARTRKAVFYLKRNNITSKFIRPLFLPSSNPVIGSPNGLNPKSKF
jgi:hypothetical protein